MKNLVKLNYLKATNDYTTFYDNSFIAHFIAIPTEQDGKPYFKILFNVLQRLVKILKKKKKIKPVIIIESNLSPKCSEKKVLPYNIFGRIYSYWSEFFLTLQDYPR